MESARMRDYWIALLCAVLTLFVVILFGTIFLSFIGNLFQPTAPIVSSECGNESANIFITADKNLKDVKCVALDKDSVVSPEIVIGDLPKGSRDVCRYKLSKATTEPLRFEVQYDGGTRREVCNMRDTVPPGFID